MARSLMQQERLFTLLLALMETRSGLTRAELFARVPGYIAGDEGASQQRMFERDKLELRDAGYAIETVEDFDDNKFTKYRLRQDSLTDLEAMTFDSGERMLLALALRLWEESALGTDARRARMRLRADPDFTDDVSNPIQTTSLAIDPALTPLRTACDEGLLARFDYHRQGDIEPRARSVQAWSVVLFAGRWLLYGWCEEREAPRTFLLRRITSRVRTAKVTRRVAPPADPAQVALENLKQLWESQRAVVSVVAGSDADMRLRRRPGTETRGTRLLIHYSDEALLADELTGYAGDVEVRTPDSLAAAVRDRLMRIAAAHPVPDTEES